MILPDWAFNSSAPTGERAAPPTPPPLSLRAPTTRARRAPLPSSCVLLTGTAVRCSHLDQDKQQYIGTKGEAYGPSSHAPHFASEGDLLG